MTTVPSHNITSKDNTFLKDLRRLTKDSTAYRKQGCFWVEGDHLCRAALVRGQKPAVGVFKTSFWPLAGTEWTQAAMKNIVIPDAIFDDLSGLESPASMGFVFNLPPLAALDPAMATVILDRVQDAGNVGSILRSASAFGFTQIIAFKGTAALWSPKVLRAGMGAHWGLQLIEGVGLHDLAALEIPIVVTSSHHGEFLNYALDHAGLPSPCAWALGHEGQGVSPELEAMAQNHIRIAQPGGEESLNVAAAAAICLHASSVISRPL